VCVQRTRRKRSDAVACLLRRCSIARGPREINGRSIGDTRRPPTKKTFGTVEVDHTWPGGAPERLNIVVDYINLLQLKASIDAAVNEIHRYDRRHLSGRKAGIGLNYERRLNGAGRLSVVPADCGS
jgi:hypothetical protein